MRKNNKNNSQMKIGGLALSCDVGVSTVLYYQRLGLLPEPPKPKNGGYRIYAESHVERLRQIRNAQAYGFTLNEIKTIFFHHKNEDCASVRSLIEERLEAINTQIRTLGSSRKSLSGLLASCEGKCSNGDCPLFNKLGLKKP
jgi:MerR family mercuric resistance operon transcriptional regulator